MIPKDSQKLLAELEASRTSRRRAWDNLQEIRLVLKETTGMVLSSPAEKTIDCEGRLVKDGLKKALSDRQNALAELADAIWKYRKIAAQKPLTLHGAEYAAAVKVLDKAIDDAEGLLLE